MPNKKQPENKKVLDISRPKKRPASGTAATGAPSLVIPKRTVINPAIVDDESDASQETVQLKHVAKSIEPTSAPEVTEPKADDSIIAARPTPQPVASTDAASTPQATSTETDAAPTQTPAPAKPAPKEELEPEAQELQTEDTGDAGTPADAVTTDTENKSLEHPDVRKALEEAKRQEQLQGYIEKREFFVPINAVAKKRSLKVTIGLILIEVILGLFLLNLMLDAGLIYLLQKIPHTHFFDLQ